MDYSTLTNKELKQLVQELNISVTAKNPGKPNKDELVSAIESFKAKQDAMHGSNPELSDTDEDDIIEVSPATEPELDESEEEEEETEEEAPVNAVTAPVKITTMGKFKGRNRGKILREDVFRKERYIITDMQENQTKDLVVSVGWGNRTLGGQTEFINLNGEPQYIRRGAIKNIIATTTVIHEPKDGGGENSVVKPRFVLQKLEGMTQEELAELGRKQALRNAKYA